MKKTIGPYTLPWAPFALVSYPTHVYGAEEIPNLVKGEDRAIFAGKLMHAAVDARLLHMQYLCDNYAFTTYNASTDKDFIDLCVFWSKSMLTLVDLLKDLLTKHLMHGLNFVDTWSAESSMRFATGNMYALVNWMLLFEIEVNRLRPTNPDLRRCNDLLTGISLPLLKEMQKMATTLSAGSEEAQAKLTIVLEMPPVLDEIEEILKNFSPKIRIESRHRENSFHNILATSATFWYFTSRLSKLFTSS